MCKIVEKCLCIKIELWSGEAGKSLYIAIVP